MTTANNNSCTHLLHPRDPSYTFKECEKKKCLDLCSLYVGSLFPLVLISSLWTTSKGGGALAFISSNDGHNEFHYTAFAFFVMIFVAVVGGKVQYWL